MIRKADPSIAERAKQIYHERLKAQLELSDPDSYVAIEPDSGEHFLGTTLSEAIGKSRQKYPNRLAHAMRVGHDAAVHFGYKSMPRVAFGILSNGASDLIVGR